MTWVRLQDAAGRFLTRVEVPDDLDRLPDVLLWTDAEFVHVDGVVYRPGSRRRIRSGSCRTLIFDDPLGEPR